MGLDIPSHALDATTHPIATFTSNQRSNAKKLYPELVCTNNIYCKIADCAPYAVEVVWWFLMKFNISLAYIIIYTTNLSFHVATHIHI